MNTLFTPKQQEQKAKQDAVVEQKKEAIKLRHPMHMSYLMDPSATSTLNF